VVYPGARRQRRREGRPALPDAWRGRNLPASAFPELLVRETGWAVETAALVRDYHDWIAPRLLILPQLSVATRQRLEAAASVRPEALEQTYRLLPRRLDAARLNTALVVWRLACALPS
jgi:hypothetical protein